MGIFSKSKAAPVVRSTAMDYYQMVEFLGLPPGTGLRDGAFHQLFMPAITRLIQNENKPYQSVELVNRGNAVTVEISGKAIGKLDDRCLPDAVQVLRHYGGQRAPAFLSHTRKGNTYTITCIDPLWDGSILT
jgi:hypothetical protein